MLLIPSFLSEIFFFFVGAIQSLEYLVWKIFAYFCLFFYICLRWFFFCLPMQVARPFFPFVLALCSVSSVSGMVSLRLCPLGLDIGLLLSMYRVQMFLFLWGWDRLG